MIEKPIFLIGMMGSGKSSLARSLSQALSLPLIDTDLAIEKEFGLSISEVFSQHGEASFRAKEKALIHTLSPEPQIIACGGGLPCYNGLMNVLLEKGVVIYLQAPARILFERINTETDRPLLSRFEDFSKRLMERTNVYEQAHYTIDANQSEQQVLSECIQLLSIDPS